MTEPVAAARRWDAPLAVLVVGIVLVVTIVAVPVLLQEQTRDWVAYQQAAGRLVAGQPLYVWQLATPDDEYYLYPPGMAAAWLAVGSPLGLLAVKVLALASVGSLAPRVAGPAGRRGLVAVGLAIGALVWPPNAHDLILGNVMALYVDAASIVVVRRGWLGAGPLGLVLALAAKPAAIPLMLWLAVRRPADAARVVACAAMASAVFAAAIGPGRYVEYLQSLPRLTTVAVSFTGNVGLVTISPALAVAGIAAGWLVALYAGVRLDENTGAAVALAAMLVAQPTIGFNYAGLLFPAMAILAAQDRRVGAATFAIGTPLMLVSPVTAAAGVIAAAVAVGRRYPHAARATSG